MGTSHSGPAFYYGNETTENYQTDNTTVGELVTREIDLRGEAGVVNDLELKFSYLLQTEGTPNYDLATVFVETTTDGVNWSRQPALASNHNSGQALADRPTITDTTNWDTATISLSSYRNQRIRLVFRFDSIDNLGNDYKGWYIDDIAVRRVAKELTTSTTLSTTAVTAVAAIGK